MLVFLELPLSRISALTILFLATTLIYEPKENNQTMSLIYKEAEEVNTTGV